jgi:hypothetical protein
LGKRKKFLAEKAIIQMNVGKINMFTGARESYCVLLPGK